MGPIQIGGQELRALDVGLRSRQPKKRGNEAQSTFLGLDLAARRTLSSPLKEEQILPFNPQQTGSKSATMPIRFSML
ncbi:MAG TPA: hypothetical protein VKN18_00780 [Blastocatellia bacterium]|nr:hypothetical protein [Blastocatellia bacterium]